MFELSSFLIRKRGARQLRTGVFGDWENPTVFQLPDGRLVYVVNNDWKFEGSEGSGYRSLMARLDSEVHARVVAEYQAQLDAQSTKLAQDERRKQMFLKHADEIYQGMILAGEDPRFDVSEYTDRIEVRFSGQTWVEFDKRTYGVSAIAEGKTVAGFAGVKNRLRKYGSYEGA